MSFRAAVAGIAGRGACCIAFLSFQAILVLAVCAAETFRLVRPHSASAPVAVGHRAEARVSPETAVRTRLRQALVAYLHLAGIETGYGFFAPNVPRSYDLAFEAHLPTGGVERVPLTFRRSEDTLRWHSVMDYVGQTTSGPLREVMLKLIAHSVARQYPAATRMRAVLGTMVLPTPEEFREGKRAEHRELYVYDFRMADETSAP